MQCAKISAYHVVCKIVHRVEIKKIWNRGNIRYELLYALLGLFRNI